MPAALAAAWNCSPTIFGESGHDAGRRRRVRGGPERSDRAGDAAPHEPDPLTSPSWCVLLRRTVTSTPSPSAASSTSAQRSALTSLRRIPAAHEEESRDHGIKAIPLEPPPTRPLRGQRGHPSGFYVERR